LQELNSKIATQTYRDAATIVDVQSNENFDYFHLYMMIKDLTFDEKVSEWEEFIGQKNL
jgi:hypothetical protein